MILAYRYAGHEIREIWSEDRRVAVYRRLWVALAESLLECGFARIKQEQIDKLKEHVGSFAEDPAQRHRLTVLEEQTRHDVMAHIHLFGELCPAARDIIHVGATSCDITDNADLVLIRESLVFLRHRLVGVVDAFAKIASKYADVPCVAYTHYQPAQLTTVGKRMCLWLNDWIADYEETERLLADLKFRGLKGAAGTQDSFCRLVPNVSKLESVFAAKMGFGDVYPITGQTYSRKLDSRVMDVLSGVGQTAHKMGTDVRLLCHDGELDEERTESQVGSSAMPYKRNPMRAERLCGIARYLVNESHNAENTAMTQWLERTLDDSSVRRISFPNAFFAADAVLRLAAVLANGVTVNSDVIARNVEKHLPFILTEPVLMEAVMAGNDRQTVHDVLRVLARSAADRVKVGEKNGLVEELRKRQLFDKAMAKVSQMPLDNVGRAVEQVREYVECVVDPVRSRYPDSVAQTVKIYN